MTNEIIQTRATLRHAVESEGDVEVRGQVDWTTMKRVDLVFPVGIIIEGTWATAAAVAEATGGGTWEAFGPGRVVVGLDATQAEFDTFGETGGAKTASIAAHSLNLSHSGVTVADHPAHDHGDLESVPAPSSGPNAAWDAGARSTPHGPQSHVVTQPNPHNTNLSHADVSTVQPYIVAYRWLRTA